MRHDYLENVIFLINDKLKMINLRVSKRTNSPNLFWNDLKKEVCDTK